MSQVQLSKSRQLEADIEALKAKYERSTVFEKPKILEQIGVKSFELSKVILRLNEQLSDEVAKCKQEVKLLKQRLNDKWGAA